MKALRCVVEESGQMLTNINGLDRKTKLFHVERIVHIGKTNKLIWGEVQMEKVIIGLRNAIGDSDTMIRENAIRAIRHMVVNGDAVLKLRQQYIQLYTTRSMERDDRCLPERIQAIKLVKKIMETDPLQVPMCFVRALIAIASSKEDKCKRICLETLRELLLVNTKLVAHCDGIRTLMDAIVEPSCQDIAESITTTIVFAMNNPTMRMYFRPSLDLQVLFAPFTETDKPSGTERRQKWAASRRAIVLMMRTWAGIVYLASEKKGGLYSLVELLRQPVGEDIQLAVLQTVYEIFYIPPTFTTESGRQDPSSNGPAEEKPTSMLQGNQTLRKASNKLLSIPPHNLLDNYTIMVLLAFIHCGILEALIKIGISRKERLSVPATTLLSEMLRLASKLLPEEHCAKLLALPTLVDVASSASLRLNVPTFDREKEQALHLHGFDILEASTRRERSIRSSEVLAELAEAVSAIIRGRNSNRSTLYENGVQMAAELLRGTNRPLHRTEASLAQLGSSRERIVFELKSTMDAQLDDATFKDMLYQRSRVLLGKDWFKWDWDIIAELLEGPLTHPTRLSEAMKTKFFKRLSGFFRCDPGNKGYFAHLPWIPDYVPYIRPACQMYTLLLNHPEGLYFLKTDRRGQLLSEIVSALELEARPEAAIVESHIGALQARMFSPEFCSRRMLREYFTLLGLMSSSKEGLRLLEQSNLFDRLYVLGKMQGHDFLCRLILANLDYTVEGSSRKLLQQWMMDGSKSLRLYATSLLRALLRSEEVDFASWGIDVLSAQLSQEHEVAEAALSVLEEASRTPKYLLAMILKRPTTLTKLPSASNLLLRFLSLPEGLVFLNEMQYIPSLLEKWRKHDRLFYVNQVENRLFRGLNFYFDGFTSKTKSNIESSEYYGPAEIPVNVPLRRGGRKEKSQTTWGLEWLFRLPWNMEVKIVGPPGSGPPSNLTLDTFVDASRIHGPSSNDSGKLQADHNSIRIKGTVVDARNLPQPMGVNSQQTLQACLYLGTQPVDRNGYTTPGPQSNGGFILSHSKNSSANQANGQGGRTRLNENLEAGNYDGGTHGGKEGDEFKDWSTCGPEQRTAASLVAPESQIYSHGESAQWTFKVESPSDDANDKTKIKRIWLKSVEFTLQLLPQKAMTVPMPPHLYGELAKTSDGCEILRRSGHVEEFLAAIRDPGCIPLECRASLWALGHIAASTRGFDMIKNYADDFLDIIMHMTTSSEILSIRGTCFYVIGLLSRSAPGRRALHLRDWDCPLNTRATSAIPLDTSSLFKLPEYNHMGSPATQDIDLSIPVPALQNEWVKILELVGNLSSHITQKEALASLNKLKSATPVLFGEPGLKLYALQLLESYKFRLNARQYVHNLFDKAVLDNQAWEVLQEGQLQTGCEIVKPLIRRRASSSSLPSALSYSSALTPGYSSKIGAKSMSSGSSKSNNVPMAPYEEETSICRPDISPATRLVRLNENVTYIGAPEAVV